MSKLSQSSTVNFYRKNPLHVAVLNSKTLDYDKIYVIINSPPPNVMRAVKLLQKGSEDGKSTLANYFGPSWKKLLIPELRHAAIGGKESKNLFSAFTESPTETHETQTTDSVIYVDYSIYPEDSIETLKNKLYIITGIAPYRQHVNINGINPYRFILQDNLFIPTFGAAKQSALYGVPIDRNIELYRGTIKIVTWEHETLGSFTSETIAERTEHTKAPVHVVELVDFNNIFSEVMAKPGIINDNYQFDLLYYGAAIAFWPQLSREAFKVAISNPTDMINQFPLLNPSPDILVKRFATEKQLIDKTYEYAINPPKVYRVSTRPFSAISYTYVANSESMPAGINLRNIFDLFKLDAKTCVSRLYFVPNGESSFKNIIKKHILAAEEIVRRVYEKAIKRPSVIIATDTTTLTIHEDQIYFEQIWKEDSRVDYKDAIIDAEKQSNKIIESINSMGVAAFPIGTKIPTGKYDKIIRSNIAAFWPRVLTTNGFAEFKRLIQYYNGSLYEIRSSGTGSVILMFKKGMTDFDIPRLLKFYNYLKEDELIEFINTYAYLTNPIALKRWQMYYSGKIVRIYHKTSEIKIEALDVTIEEFEIIKRYFFTMLDLFITKSVQGIIRLSQKMEPQYEKFLQRLREHDPELYDLRRHDKNANVYSIICQSGRQPFIYDEYDLKKVPHSKTRNLVKYWNFTENRPAYYECPYKEYPYLGFRSNEHPKGYCLPCCQKLSAVPGTKQALINNLCVKEHKITEKSEELITELEGTSDDIARHAVQYGKLISHGRIGECPAMISNGLFYNAVAKPYSISLIGVRQHMPATSDAGFFFSLCYILNIFSDNLIAEFVEVIKHLSDSYYTLGQGEANKFESGEQLAAALQETLLTEEQFTPFTQDINLIPILIDLMYIRFGVSVVIIIDTKSTNPIAEQDFILHTNPTTNSQLITNAESLELAVIFKTTTGYYPFAIINKRMYSKYSELTRRTFRIKYDPIAGKPGESKVTPISDTIAETVIDVLKANEQKTLSLATIKQFVAKDARYVLIHKLIGVSDTCYGVALAIKSEKKKQVFIPVNNSPHHIDGIPAVYGVRDDATVSKQDLMSVVDDLNIFLKKNGYTEIIPVSNLLNNEGKTIGFISDGLYYYHRPEVKSRDVSATTSMPYNTLNIDKSIFKYHGKPQPLDSIIANLANSEMYDNYLYNFLLFEFATILQDERNEPLRKDIIQAVRNTDFHNNESLIKLSDILAKKLEKFPGDQKIIKVLITEREDDVINYIHNAVFEFDSLIIQQLRDMPINTDDGKKMIIKKLDDILNNRVHFQKAPTDKPIANIFTSCQNPNQANCNGSKLIIDKEKYYTFLDIMAQDVTNQLKHPAMFLIASGVRTAMKFIIRPDERLYIF